MCLRDMQSRAVPHVVIIGGGFAGLYAAHSLRRSPVTVTLVDRRNHHLFQPLLYQVAGAALNPSDVAYPLRKKFRSHGNIRVILAEAKSINTKAQSVQLDGSGGEGLHYDYLIVATGATHAYFGHSEWEAHAPGLKTIEDALEIRRRILLAFEAAERVKEGGDDAKEEREAWLTFTVVGGGATGVELAGTLSEISRHALAKDFRSIDPTHARILLLEGGPRVLPAFSANLSKKAEEQLRSLGVEVRTRAAVTSIDDHGVCLGESTRIRSRTVLWAAGVTASPLGASLGVPLDSAGRVVVDRTLRPPGINNVFVVGDLAAAKTARNATVPGIAPAAIQGGKFAANTITKLVTQNQSPISEFVYRDKGILATIGRSAAVAQFGPLELSGFIAWFAWGVIHIFFLIGFRNRSFVMLEWLWSYVTFQRGARLITGTPKKKLLPPWQ